MFKVVLDSVTHENFQGINKKAETEILANQLFCFLGKVTRRESHILDDDKKLIELIMIVFGCPQATIHWRAPGPVYNAQ